MLSFSIVNITIIIINIIIIILICNLIGRVEGARSGFLHPNYKFSLTNAMEEAKCVPDSVSSNTSNIHILDFVPR